MFLSKKIICCFVNISKSLAEIVNEVLDDGVLDLQVPPLVVVPHQCDEESLDLQLLPLLIHV